MQTSSSPIRKTATILNGASLSSEIDTMGGTLGGIIMPSAWTASDKISFQVSATSGGTFVDLYDDANSEVYISGVAASKGISFDTIALKIAPWRFIKIRSGLTGAAVNQGADRTLELAMK